MQQLGKFVPHRFRDACTVAQLGYGSAVLVDCAGAGHCPSAPYGAPGPGGSADGGASRACLAIVGWGVLQAPGDLFDGSEVVWREPVDEVASYRLDVGGCGGGEGVPALFGEHEEAASAV